MKQILTTLFIPLYLVLAGFSHDDAEKLMEGGNDHGNESPLNEYSIEFKVEATDKLNHLYMGISLEKDAEVTVDWGDGLSDHYKHDDSLDSLPSWVNKLYGLYASHLYFFPHKVYKVRISTVGLSSFSIFKEEILSIRDLQFGICPDLRELKIYDIENKNLTIPKVSKLIIDSCPNVTKIDFLTREETVDEIHIYDNPVLKEVDIHNIAYGWIGFSGNSNLKKIKLGKFVKSTDVKSTDDVSTTICVNSNNLDANALNEIFRKLPNKEDTNFITPYISFRGNPGTETCDRSIYENKGWIISPW